MNKFDMKVLTFATALSSAYLDEEERVPLLKLDSKEEELTEDFTAMVYAIQVLYSKITKDYTDSLGFSHIINRLVVQKQFEKEISPAGEATPDRAKKNY